jgi:hypothetical protein
MRYSPLKVNKCFWATYCLFNPEDVDNYVLQKQQTILNRLHSIISQKTVLFKINVATFSVLYCQKVSKFVCCNNRQLLYPTVWTLNPEDVDNYLLQKHQIILNRLHSIISHKTVLFKINVATFSVFYCQKVSKFVWYNNRKLPYPTLHSRFKHDWNLCKMGLIFHNW